MPAYSGNAHAAYKHYSMYHILVSHNTALPVSCIIEPHITEVQDGGKGLPDAGLVCGWESKSLHNKCELKPHNLRIEYESYAHGFADFTKVLPILVGEFGRFSCQGEVVVLAHVTLQHDLVQQALLSSFQQL